jgi:hypothetical protein
MPRVLFGFGNTGFSPFRFSLWRRLHAAILRLLFEHAGFRVTALFVFLFFSSALGLV